MPSRMQPGMTTEDYRLAMGDTEAAQKFGTLAYQWEDKPHRLVYDLCGEVEHLQAEIARLQHLIYQAGEMMTWAAKANPGIREPEGQALVLAAADELRYMTQNLSYEEGQPTRTMVEVQRFAYAPGNERVRVIAERKPGKVNAIVIDESGDIREIPAMLLRNEMELPNEVG